MKRAQRTRAEASEGRRGRLIATRRPRAERAYLTRRRILALLLRGFPAVVAAVAFVGLIAKAGALPREPLRLRLLRNGLEDYRNGRTPGALVSLQRAVDDGIARSDADPQDRFDAATALAALGDPARADDLLDALAPPGRPGFPRAHLRRAAALIDRPDRSRTDLRAAEEHLLLALKGEPQLLEANARLVQIYVATDRHRQAVPYLERSSRARPEMLIVLARIDALEGQRERALERLKEARARFQTLSGANPDDHEARLHWAETFLIAEDFPGAARILKDGFERSDDPRFPKALGRLYLAWHDVRARDPNTPLADRLDLLEQGLRYDSDELLLLDRFSAPLQAGGEVAARARAALREQIERGRDTAAVRYALGVDAFADGRIDEARDHWERAYRGAPDIPYYANNYACALMASSPPRNDEALRIIGPVADRWPGIMAFRDTRGQVFARLGRWYEARADLEEALRIGPPTPETRIALADAYDHLNLPEKAAEQRKLAGAQAKAAGMP